VGFFANPASDAPKVLPGPTALQGRRKWENPYLAAITSESMRAHASSLICCIGFVLCVAAYHPGLQTPDSLAIHREAQNLAFTDWHSPVMALLWAALDHVAPSPWGLFIFLLILYWGALYLLAGAASRIDQRIAPLMLVLGFMPFAINLAGTLLKDTLLAESWLMCSALAFGSETSRRRMSIGRKVAAWTFFQIGSWARPNAIFAAVPLGLYLLESGRAFGLWKRGLFAVFLMAEIWCGNWLITYPILHAEKTHLFSVLLTFDLGGISHYSGKNYFPGSWTPEESARIVSSCYTPEAWDTYAWIDCKFVVERLKQAGLWGSDSILLAWITAVVTEPLSYLHHRWAHFAHFMTFEDGLFFPGNTLEEVQQRVGGNPALRAMQYYVLGTRNRLPIFRPIFWFVLACICIALAPACSRPSRRFVTALNLSSLVYLLTFLFFGVASGVRYDYWAVLATSSTAIIVACELIAMTSRRQQTCSISPNSLS
jgi:hypothetical protein